MNLAGIKFFEKKARSAYAFIAVCDSARTVKKEFPILRRVAVRRFDGTATRRLRGASSKPSVRCRTRL